MRIAVVQVIHESNTFSPTPTGLKDFRVLRGGEFMRFFAGAHNECTGFFEGAGKFGFEAVPLFSAAATPGGVVTAEAFDWLARELVAQLRAAMPFDGILLSLHGAFVSQNHMHADAEFARLVRNAFGAGMPVVCTHDPHGNISPELAQHVDALVIYKTNPHIDQREIGLQAAEIMSKMVRGEARPTQAFVQVPMIVNIVHQHTSSPPLRDLWQEMSALEHQAGVLATSMSLGYQYADVMALGNVVCVVTNNDQAQADQLAKYLAGRLWDLREQLEVRIPSAAEAVRQAMQVTGQLGDLTWLPDHFHQVRANGPVVLVDIGDNVGGGSAADGTFLLAELLAQQASGWQVTLADAQAVQACVSAGIGARVSIEVGAKADGLHGKPVRVSGRVKCLHDGNFEERAARHGGVRWTSMGTSAVIEVDMPSTGRSASYVLLTTARTAPMSANQLSAVGINPEYLDIVTVKAAIAWKAAYEPIMRGFIVADTPGATQVNPKRWVYKNARAGLHGLQGW